MIQDFYCQKVLSLEFGKQVMQNFLGGGNFIPNAFTPDGDPLNHSFLPVFTSGFDPQDYHLLIFNRWGEVIFESYNSANGWDGNYASGEPVADGVYVYAIDFGDLLSDERYEVRGHVTLLR